MKMIAKTVKHIDEELRDAEEYASKYLECKMYGNENRAAIYRGMAEDELRHSSLLHKIATEDIAMLRESYTPPQNMLDKWNETHKTYVEKDDMIRGLLK